MSLFHTLPRPSILDSVGRKIGVCIISSDGRARGRNERERMATAYTGAAVLPTNAAAEFQLAGDDFSSVRSAIERRTANRNATTKYHLKQQQQLLSNPY